MSERRFRGSDRRGDKRLPADIKVQMIVGGKPFSGETLDLSQSGMRLHTAERFSEGATLQYGFVLPNPLDVTITGYGEVVWNKETQSYEHGVRFREIRRELRERLEDFLRIRDLRIERS